MTRVHQVVVPIKSDGGFCGQVNPKVEIEAITLC